MPPSDADVSRPRSAILGPTAEDSLHLDNGCRSASPESRKARGAATGAAAGAMNHLLKPSIAVKLPLACIDLAASDSDLPQSRFYESYIKILDLESRLAAAPSVLIARAEPKGTVHAIERQGNGLYVICKLGPWVDLRSLAGRATALSHDRLHPANPRPREQDALNALTTPRIYNEHKKKRAAIEAIQSLVRKRGKAQSVPPSSNPAGRDGVTEPDTSQNRLPSPGVQVGQQLGPGLAANAADPIPGVDETADPAPRHTADDILDNIRAQYFEALYRSMGSLAYFAKGPLSRARSAFHLDLESNLDMADLIDFLKGLVLTTVQIDKKYRETIPDVISRMKNQVESSDENGRGRRRPKKMKVGKDGLYPLEDENIRKWWTANKPDLGDDKTNYSMSQIKSHVWMLRTRETQLQMIVILEILALEPLKAAGEAGANSLPLLPGVGQSQLQERSMAPPPPPKRRNKHKLPVLIDVHADRLTIWQSIASDEQLQLEDSQVPRGPVDDQALQKASSEPLKDFCVDVIVPFFSARLPELCDAVNRKLGGPAIRSPLNSKSSRPSLNRREQKPGAAARRLAPPNNRKTLQRALSTEQQHRRGVSRGPGNAIALMRSASSASSSIVKREGNEPVPLKAHAKGEPVPPRQQQPSLSRGSIATSLEDPKASKKAMVEAELRNAISALRKPNREVVGKAMAEADECRVLTSLSTKKMKRAPRRGSLVSVQVKATPANTRFRDVLAADPKTSPDVPLESPEYIIPPSSSGTRAPSSGPRVGRRDAFMSSTSPAAGLVEGTPARPSTKPSFLRRPVNGDTALSLLPSPLVNRMRAEPEEPLLVAGNAVKARAGLSFSTTWHDGVAATPVKGGASRRELCESPTPVAEPSPRVSIYQQLGWDDIYGDVVE